MKLHPGPSLMLALMTAGNCAAQSNTAPSKSANFPPSISIVSPIKSPTDARDYESFVLDNGMRVLLISDPNTDSAAAAVDVNVGSGSDPVGREGLAHFLEHMLFLGTEKYPDAAEYKSFLAEHAGGDNAYTSFDHTNYYFYVDEAHLEPALDRFAQFFIAPKFNPELVARERQVVQSEYSSKIKSDGRRSFYAQKQAFNSKHPYARFSVGSLETLADREDASIRDELVRFYQTHYSSHIMTLVVLGKEPIPTLKMWAKEKFSPVKRKPGGRLSISEPLFNIGFLPARINVEPVKNIRQLSLSFPIPPTRDHYRSKPAAYLAHLVGHEGDGSLLAELKRRGWAEELSAGVGYSQVEEATFSIGISLTETGLEEVNAIIAHVFRYLDIIIDKGITARVFNEQRDVAQLQFRFEEELQPVAYVRSLANDLHEYPVEDVLRARYAYDYFRPDLVGKFLKHLRPDNVLVSVVAKNMPTNRTTDWYGIKYGISAIPSRTLSQWRRSAAEARLAMPSANPFVPSEVAVKTPRSATASPKTIAQSAGYELWHQQDTTFDVPRADFFVSMRSPIASDTASHVIMTRLYTRMINDALNPLSYPANVAGLSYSLYQHSRGLSIRISGFDEKQGRMLDLILDAMTRSKLEASRFDILKAQLLRQLENTKNNPPYRRINGALRDLMVAPRWPQTDLIAALEPVTLEELKAFGRQLLSEVQIVALSHGNIYPNEAKALGEKVRQRFAGVLKDRPIPRARTVKLEPGARYRYEVENNQPDSAALLYFQGVNRSIEERATFALMAQVVSSPFFDELRTQKELGYVVFANHTSLLEVPGLSFLVQSPIADPDALRGHMEQFLAGFAKRLTKMSQEEFARHRQSLLSRLQEQDLRLTQRTNRYWREIDEQQYGFDLREQVANALEQLSLETLRKRFREALIAGTRTQVMVYATGNQTPTTDDHTNTSGEDVRLTEVDQLKRKGQHFPLQY